MQCDCNLNMHQIWVKIKMLSSCQSFLICFLMDKADLKENEVDDCHSWTTFDGVFSITIGTFIWIFHFLSFHSASIRSKNF